MKHTRTLIITVASVAAAIIVGLAVLFALTVGVKADYAGRIEKGNKYLDTGDYDKALVEFQAALDMDEDKEEAYEGLYRTYFGLGHTMLSQEILERGLARTGSDNLRATLAIAFPNSDMLAEGDGVIKGEEGEPALNITLLEMIAGSAYADYDHQYDVTLVSSEGNIYDYGIEELGLKLEYDNNGSTRKISQTNNTPFRENMPDSVSVDNLSYLFGTTASMTVDDIKSLRGVEEFEEIEGRVTFKAAGCRVTIDKGEDGMIVPTANNTIVSLKASGEEEDDEDAGDTRVLKGKITDAKNGDAVGDAKIKIYAGRSTVGDAIETKSGSSGEYSADVAPGDNHIVVEKDGYITGEFDVYVLTKSDTTYQDCAISPEMGEGEIRIVLTWGDSPRDLDSYLRGTTGSGKRVMTRYDDKRQYDSNGELAAELDLDDKDGNGPETTTLYDMEGSYEFIVTDFYMTSSIGRSNAQVKVYKGNALVETVDIPTDAVNMWKVIEIEKGEIKVINKPHSERTSPGSK